MRTIRGVADLSGVVASPELLSNCRANALFVILVALQLIQRSVVVSVDGVIKRA